MNYDNVNLNYNTNTEVIYIDKIKKNRTYDFFKRFMDIVLCLIACIIAVPITFVACLCVIIESKGSPVYKQERLGKNGKTFMIYKIRSMYAGAENKCGAKWAEKDDPRVTKVGRFIRKTRIDELPQLFNIIKGDMSIVGPRPEREYFYNKFEKGEAPGFSNRLFVKPGLTGMAQVSGGYDITPAEKLQLDVQYMQERSLRLDIKIILKTVQVVFSGEGAR